MLKIKKTAFCTYFDRNYLPKGLAMIFSFLKFNPEGIIYVLCFDRFTLDFIKKIGNKNIRSINLKEFEDEKLIEIKRTRTTVEYYWTCTPSLPLYILQKHRQYSAVVYLDADLCFYDSLETVFSELGDKSIYTVEHRYPPGQEGREKISGKFNVAFQIFRNNDEGLRCLKRWRNQCLDWCYWKEEDGKMGDQMYLNEWPELYQNLVISKNIGVDTAPWNVSQYVVSKKKGRVYIDNKPLVCYHFHQLQMYDKDNFTYASGYRFKKHVVDYIYRPYVKILSKKINYIQSIFPKYVLSAQKIPLIIRIKNYMAFLIGPLYWRLTKKQ